MPARRAIQNRRLLGQRISRVRRERGWTQEQLAERLGVSVRYLQAVEAGEENLTIDSLTQLALRLDLSLGDLDRPGLPFNAPIADPYLERRRGHLVQPRSRRAALRKEADLGARGAPDEEVSTARKDIEAQREVSSRPAARSSRAMASRSRSYSLAMSL